MKANARPQVDCETSPASEQFLVELRPRNAVATFHLTLVSFITLCALLLSTPLCFEVSFPRWILGQLLFALVFLQWFVVLHEAGHQTFFRGRRLNTLCGHLAGFFSLIPFDAWRFIHSRHHRWTGWQDKDSTTAALVPRPMKVWERKLIRFGWAVHFPFSAFVYRVSNYWYLPRIRRYISSSQYPRIRRSVLFWLAAYIVLGSVAGWQNVIQACGAGLALSFMAQDVLLLSQHTHIPQQLSHGAEVSPFSPEEQVQFTRTLRFPAWFSFLILHFDAHELHHRYVRVPGYDLGKIPLKAEHEVHWWTWLREMKRVPGDVFLFQNSDETGFPW